MSGFFEVSEATEDFINMVGRGCVINLVKQCPFCEKKISCSQNSNGEGYWRDGKDCCKSCATRWMIS